MLASLGPEKILSYTSRTEKKDVAFFPNVEIQDQ
jgi:hypothetical protein